MKKVTIILMSLIILGLAATAQSKATKPVTVNPVPAKRDGLFPPHPQPITIKPVPAATQKGNNAKPAAAATQINKGIPDNDGRSEKK